MADLIALVGKDVAVRRALEATFGKADSETLRMVLYGSNAQAIDASVRKGTMLAMPKMTKKLIAKPKPAPVPQPVKSAAAPAAPSVQGAVKPPAPKVSKSDEQTFTVYTEIAKFDDEEMTVFGWASITEVDGVPVVDRQGDSIDTVEMAKAAYEYVVGSRVGGRQHQRTQDGDALKVSDMIESMVFTPEKIAKMGLPAETPVGWWVGYRLHDENTWADVKSGEVTGFSIHGRGKRRPAEEMA